jgi:predicted esterase YcpF (UPF0227 family)
MNIHIFYDKLAILMAEKTFRNFRFFSDSLESEKISAHIKNINLSLPDFNQEGTYEIKAAGPSGKLDPAFLVARWLGPGYPTIIYHHGNNERPFDFGPTSKNSFKNILLSGSPAPANLIALRAPFHKDLKTYMQSVRQLDQFTALLASSVCLMEGLVHSLRSKSAMPVALAGISLGGWVVNLHKAYFDTAGIYIPMLAGAALAEVFLTSRYSRLAGQKALENPEDLRSILNFEDDYKKRDLENVFPILARHDQIIEYERQSPAYKGKEIVILDKGHTTAALASKELREHILSAVKKKERAS